MILQGVRVLAILTRVLGKVEGTYGTAAYLGWRGGFGLIYKEFWGAEGRFV